MDETIPDTRELERLERRMERKWYDLAMAEQRKQPVHVLERMYDAYLKSLEDYVRHQRRTSQSSGESRRAS